MLAVVLVGTFMAILDVAIVNVAIPSLREDLHASYGGVELVISAYTLTYACLLVTGGRLGDLYGRRRLFIMTVLIAARGLQGVGGALMYPQVLAIIQVTFDGQDRVRALGIFGSVVGIAAIAAVKILPEDEPEPHMRLDLGGVALIGIALLLLAVPLLEGRDNGWPAWMLGCLVLSIPAFAAFLAYERRVAERGGRPLVRLSLFRDRGFAGGIPIAMLFLASYASFLLMLAIYLQAGLGFSPLHSGLVYTPAAVGFFITSLSAPKLVPLLGRHVLSVGYIIAALGLLATAATVAAAGTDLVGWELAPTLFIAGLGQGLGMSPLVGTIIAGLEPSEAGAGAGVVTTTLQVGNVLGVALGGLLFFTLVGSAHPGSAYADAFAYALPACAVLLLVAAALVHVLPVAKFEAQNALIERLPGWATGFAYSMFLMTGGRAGDRLFEDVLSHVAERRIRRTEQAPMDPGEFLAFHFDAAAEDGAWFNYLAREALAYGNGPVPHEDERLPIIQAQVDEIRRRQEAGLIDPELDPALVRLLGFAVTSYPRALPQITRMTTGSRPDDPRFIADWESFLRRLGKRLAAR